MTNSDVASATASGCSIKICTCPRTANRGCSRTLIRKISKANLTALRLALKPTTLVQDPQRSGLLLKSAQVPEQQAGVPPVHGAAAQEPQWVGSLLTLVHFPEQQVG